MKIWLLIKAETQRINNFAREHFDGSGFNDITPISDKPVKTIEKLIDIAKRTNFVPAGFSQCAL